jgi:aminopeptidase N
VVVQYRGSPQDGLLFGATVRGRRAVFADNYPQRARYWLPVVDHPSDKARVLWSVRAPPGWQVVTNAPRRCNGPIARDPLCLESQPLPTYLMVLGATRMTVSRLRPLVTDGDTVPIEVWAYPEDSAFADRVPFRRATEIAETLQRLVGPFPYARLAHVQSRTRYGGMENASAIFYAERGWSERRMREGVVRHETAHQWFGDAVTTREWPHVWLSEGFATYFAALWAEHSRGDTALVAALRAMRQDVLDSRVTFAKPVVDEALADLKDVLNSNVYEKAGFTLHMLRLEVGDSAFFRAIRSYYGTHRHANALTEDFQREVEATAGRPLDWFFDQWLRRPGVAELAVRWQWDAGQRALVLTVSQGARVAPYRLSLALDVTDASGRVRRVRAQLPAARVATVPIPLALDGAPRDVTFDPDASLLGTISVTR